ncbi:MAG: hypothetical protein KGI38_10660 [Thaumarchaeota archaeon]|nr:hypothetical protein [Nitrososphaerota archaeon]
MQPQGAPEDREPTLIRRSPFTREEKLCPKCLGPVRTTNGDLLGFVPMAYTCPKCGYYGSVYVTREDKPKED